MKILYLEDNLLYAETITEFLEGLDYEVKHHLNTHTAIDNSFCENFQLYLFDLNLPDMSGLELLKILRAANDITPVIFLTSSDTSQDLKDALSFGADGYITKPVDLDELALRIKALLRRVYGEDEIFYKGYTLNLSQQSLFKDGVRVAIKPKVFQLLHLLLQHKEKVVTISQIEDHLWSQSTHSSLNAIRVYITEIKHLIGHDALSNIRGVGYTLHE